MVIFQKGFLLSVVVDRATQFLAIFFILCIETLALAVKNSKAKPYKTKKGNDHLQEQYADDLTIFLEYTKDDDGRNNFSIKCVLSVLDKFFVLLGLGVNKYKTMLYIFSTSLEKSELAGSLALNGAQSSPC